MSRSGWRTFLIPLAVAASLLAPSAAVADRDGPERRRGPGVGCGVERIELPQGWQPEGITTDGRKLYVGSLADGSLLRAHPCNGSVTVLPRSQTGTPAVGVDYDERRNVLWVAGGGAGEIRAHDAASGRLLARYPLPPDDARFVNDLVVTADAVYATDSQNAELGVVPLTSREVPASGVADTLPLTGDFRLQPGFNANGIVRSGGHLVLVQSNTGRLFRVDPASGRADVVDLGGYELTNGDGLEIDGDIVYAVRNRDNLIAVVDLADDLSSGEVVAELSDEDFDVPTTVALVRDDLHAVNARFGIPRPAAAGYWVTRLDAFEG